MFDKIKSVFNTVVETVSTFVNGIIADVTAFFKNVKEDRLKDKVNRGVATATEMLVTLFSDLAEADMENALELVIRFESEINRLNSRVGFYNAGFIVRDLTDEDLVFIRSLVNDLIKESDITDMKEMFEEDFSEEMSDQEVIDIYSIMAFIFRLTGLDEEKLTSATYRYSLACSVRGHVLNRRGQ